MANGRLKKELNFINIKPTKGLYTEEEAINITKDLIQKYGYFSDIKVERQYGKITFIKFTIRLKVKQG